RRRHWFVPPGAISALTYPPPRVEPAPVPELKKPVPVPLAVEDKSTLKSPQAVQTSDGDVVRATGSMAVATLLSRITGFIRNVLIGSSLGAAIASAFTTANQLPNLITEIVLGA